MPHRTELRAGVAPFHSAALLACALVGCSSTTPPTPQVASTPEVHDGMRGPSVEERRIFDSLVERAERIRGHELDEPVEFVIADAETFRVELARLAVPEFEQRMHASRVALGLASATEGQTPRSRPNAVGAEDVPYVGLYLPVWRRILLRDDLAAHLLEASNRGEHVRLDLFHEIVHAIQHHSVMPDLGRLGDSMDESLARRCLWEGDAVLAAVLSQAESLGVRAERLVASDMLVPGLVDSTLAMLVLQSSAGIDPTRSQTYRTVIPYLVGGRFLARAYAHGGMDEVDAAFASRPTSMKELLHPDVDPSVLHPYQVELPDLSKLEESGLQPLFEDTRGELGALELFATTGSPWLARRAAEGWGGDRLRVYQTTDGRFVAVWMLIWDTIRDAAEAFDAAERVRPRLASPVGETLTVDRAGFFTILTFGLPEGMRRQARDEMIEIAWSASE